MASATDIESVLNEQRVFTCDPAFAADAHVKSPEDYDRLYKQSTDDPEAFAMISDDHDQGVLEHARLAQPREDTRELGVQERELRDV